MRRPFVSVVVETIVARFESSNGALCENVTPTMQALQRQTLPQEMIEQILVLDTHVAASDAEEIHRRWPEVKLVSSLRSGYFFAKNAGAAAANGELLAFIDSDCVAEPDWLEKIVARFTPEVSAIGGRTRYAGDSPLARALSVPDFAYILAERDGSGSGFNVSNVAFRRDVFLSHGFDSRLYRDGGCYLLYHQLIAEGARVLNEPRAIVHHGFDPGLRALIRKHYKRGYAGVLAYRIDDRQVFAGTGLYRRLGAISLFPITVRRTLRDWLRLLRHRRQIGISRLKLPFFCCLAVTTRTIELAGGLAAAVASDESRNQR
jgi:glycosyltransferase involved in cell wall biosynthesis